MQCHEEAGEADCSSIQSRSSILDGLDVTRLRANRGPGATSSGPQRVPTRLRIALTARLHHPQVVDDAIPQDVRFLSGCKRALAVISEFESQVRPPQSQCALGREPLGTDESSGDVVG